MPYTPPPGNQVGANFTATYTPPAGNQVGARFGGEPGFVDVLGFDALEVGSHRISFYVQVVEPSSVTSLAFGLPALNYTQFVTPIGYSTLGFGATLVENDAQGIFTAGLTYTQFGYHGVTNSLTVVFPVGYDTSAIGAHTIANYRNIVDTLGADTSEFGGTWVSNEIRRFEFDGFDTLAVGQAFISNAIQYVEPNGLTFTEFGATRVSRNIVIEPIGISGAVGTPTVRDDSQTTTPPGLMATQFGQTFVRRAFDRIAPDGIGAPDEFGDTAAYNLTQEVKVYWPFDYVAGPVTAPTVSNYDRQVYPQGFDALRIRDYHNVRLGPPPPVLSAGNTLLFGQTMVSMYVREVAPPGLSAFQDGRAVVYNAAMALYADGFTGTAFGTAAVHNGLQFVDVINRAAIDGYGTPTISYAVRTLRPPSIFDTAYGLPRISRTPQVIEPAGTYLTGFGGAYIERHQSIVYAQSLSPHTVFGLTRIENRNKVAQPIGVTSTEYGMAKVELYRRYLEPGGIHQLVFGDHGISHLSRTIRPPSITGAFGLCWVHIEPQPVAPQRVFMEGFNALGVGQHLVTANSVYPDGETFTEFGTPAVYGNVIRPKGIFEDFIADTRPSLTTTQYIILGSEFGQSGQGIDSLAMGKPRLSPHTIWAPAGAPAQARMNHPPGLEFEIDEPEFGGEHPKFGIAEISNAIRTYSPQGFLATEFGNAFVVLGGTQYVFPEGKDTKRFGIPVMLGGTRTVSPGGISAAEIGMHAVTRVIGPYQVEVAPPGLLSQAFGTAFVSTSPQEVYAVGEAEDEHGQQWVSHEYEPFQIPGFEATVFGDAWVSNYVREVAPEGFDAFTDGEEAGYFHLRMRVSTRVGGTGATVGNTLSMGTPAISLGTRIIQAFGPSTLTVPAPNVQIGVRTVGIGPGTLGLPTVDQIVLGAVFQHGVDMSTIGFATVSAGIRVAGMAGQVGTPGVAHRIGPSGFDATEFGGLVIVGNGLVCGSQVQGMMAGAMSTQAFGVAAVSQ